MRSNIKDDDSLDKIFNEIGEFKIYQVVLIILLALPCMLSAGYTYEFILASATLDYR